MPFYRAEVGAANRLLALQAGRNQSRLADFQTVDWDRALAYLHQKDQISLAEQQLAAVKLAVTEPVSILTGGPGTGKTTTIRSILRLLTARRKTVLLAAPTGRAAKRLSETTGQEAKTLHRLLEVDPSEGFRFKRDQDNPLEADVLIVDEVSMIDLILMNNLLKAVRPGTHLLLVGDADQLPSVGAGNVLRDLIAAEVIPTVRLDVIFRQAQDSTIIQNAHRINQGEMPFFPKDKADFFFFKQEDPDLAAELVVDLIAERIPRKFGVEGTRDIQLLSPMHRGSVGVGKLNERLQIRLNPPGLGKPQYQVGSRLYRVGDKVLQLRNNYYKDVFNGDVGLIDTINLEESQAVIRFDERLVDYELSELMKSPWPTPCPSTKPRAVNIPSWSSPC
jgi:exodeoxyribonuclease V alpha subunit